MIVKIKIIKIKSFFRIAILIVLILFFLKSIIFGEIGVRRYFQVRQEIELEKLKILKLENKIKVLSKNIDRFLDDDFEIEKIARQDLQMGYANEQVYLYE